MILLKFLSSISVILCIAVAVLGRHGRSSSDIPDHLKDKFHGVKMGISSSECDDGENGLDVDWDGNSVNYTCFTPKSPITVLDVAPVVSCAKKTLTPLHKCMDTSIHYNESIPSSGMHRPLWPVFGEYKFVPAQRWVHSLEHGSVVMLYDPCAHPAMVDNLRRLVTNCIRKHVITPYHGMTRERPLALVTWGCVMQMNYVYDAEVVSFIRTTAMKGPEWSVYKEGQYKKLLLKQARPPFGSNMKDSVLCPFAP